MPELRNEDGESMSYEWKSPVDLFYDKVHYELEKELDSTVTKAIQTVGINVDKEELIKALQYDRGQYEKGYKDGVASLRQRGMWIELVPNRLYKCSVCEQKIITGEIEKYRFCHGCSARMNNVDGQGN